MAELSVEELMAIAGPPAPTETTSTNDLDVKQLMAIAGPPQRSTLETINDISGQLGKGASLGFMDELQGYEAGARNWLAGLFGGGNQKSFEQNYAEEVAKARAEDAAFEAANPVSSTALQLAGGLIPGLTSGGATLAGTGGSKVAQSLAKNVFGVGLDAVPTLGQLAKTGAIQSGLYGMGTADEGNRLQQGAESALAGALFSPVAKGVSAVGNKALSIADDVGTRLKMSALGIDKADVTKAFKSQSEGLDYFPNLINELEQSGTFKQGLDYQDISDSLKKQIKEKNISVKGIIKATSEATGVDLPEFNSAYKLIDELEGSSQKQAKEILQEEILDLVDTMKNGGTVQDWQKVKTSFQGKTRYGKDNLPIRADIKKAMASDARQYIEDSAEKVLGKDVAQTLKQTNKEIGARLELQGILDEAKVRQAATNPVNSLRDIFRTTGGFGVPILLGGAEYLRSGDPTQAIAAGIGGGYLTSPKGQFSLGKNIPKIGSTINTITSKVAATPKGPILASNPESSSTFSLPKGEIMPKADDINLDNLPKKQDKRVAYVERLIDSDPIDAAIYEIESGRNPLAKNPTSSASGAFQLIKNTAKKLGVNDVFDIGENYKGFLKLKEENQAVLSRLGLDPNDGENLYRLHYLGAPVFRKYVQNKPLNEKELAQVKYLESKVMPKFSKVYNKKVNQITEV